MGRDFRSLQNSDNRVAESFLNILEPTPEKVAFLAMNFMLPQSIAQRIPWKMNDLITNETNFLRDLCNDIVCEKRQSLTESKASAQDLEADILGTMVLGGDFSDNELVDQMLTFLAAGVGRSSFARFYCISDSSTARNNSRCPYMGLLSPDPVPGCPGASTHGDSGEDSFGQ